MWQASMKSTAAAGQPISLNAVVLDDFVLNDFSLRLAAGDPEVPPPQTPPEVPAPTPTTVPPPDHSPDPNSVPPVKA